MDKDIQYHEEDELESDRERERRDWLNSLC